MHQRKASVPLVQTATETVDNATSWKPTSQPRTVDMRQNVVITALDNRMELMYVATILFKTDDMKIMNAHNTAAAL